MPPRPKDPKKILTIVSEWRTGQYSQAELAKKHKVSGGFVNKHCKGIVKDGERVVHDGVQYKQALANHDESMVSAIVDAVDERTKHIHFFNHAAITNVSKAVKKIGDDMSQNDHKLLAETISKGRDVVLGKTPETAIQINNSADSRRELSQEEIEKEMKEKGIPIPE